MRRLLPSLMILVLVLGAMMPAVIQSHADMTSTKVTGQVHEVLAADKTAAMKCCQKSKSGMDNRQGNCAADCHYLPEFTPLQNSPVLASVEIPAQSVTLLEVIYVHMRPPISI
ncbi:hypothetical protein AAFN47_25440 [Hoeflea sp. CAU 1731]